MALRKNVYKKDIVFVAAKVKQLEPSKDSDGKIIAGKAEIEP